MKFEDRILEILMKETTSELSSDENVILTEFSSKSAMNRAFLAENRAILANLPSYEEEAISMFDVDSALAKVKSQIVEPSAEIHTLSPQSKPKFFYLLKLAAAALLLVGAATMAYTYLGSIAIPSTFSAADNLEEVMLPDGTEVMLNKNSTLTLMNNYGAELRDVKLEGEAFFKVKPINDQPFMVKLGDLEIEVLGTHFNVDAKDANDNMTVFVDEGKVKVTSLKTGTKLLLTAGESSTFDMKTRALFKDKTMKYNATSWMYNKLRFENTTLIQTIQEIEDHFDITVELKNKDLFNCRYTSIFNSSDADEVLETISAAFQLQLMKEGGNTFVLTGGDCN